MLEMAYNIITHNSHIVLKMEDDPNNANCNWVCPACASYERPRTHFKDPNNIRVIIFIKIKHVQIICVHTEDPFTSICSAVESGDSKLGMLCASRQIISF